MLLEPPTRLPRRRGTPRLVAVLPGRVSGGTPPPRNRLRGRRNPPRTPPSKAARGVQDLFGHGGVGTHMGASLFAHPLGRLGHFRPAFGAAIGSGGRLAKSGKKRHASQPWRWTPYHPGFARHAEVADTIRSQRGSLGQLAARQTSQPSTLPRTPRNGGGLSRWLRCKANASTPSRVRQKGTVATGWLQALTKQGPVDRDPRHRIPATTAVVVWPPILPVGVTLPGVSIVPGVH